MRPPDLSRHRARRPSSAEDIVGITRAFEERWLDEEIPALGGLRPRDAAAAAGGGRPALVALLDDIEWTQRQHPQHFQMDVDRLRHELGLA